MESMLRRPAQAVFTRLQRVSGGPARAQVVLVLACVLALDTADVGTIGSIASNLETSLKISNTELGVLAALPALMTALATVPVGMLTDRLNRAQMLLIGIVFWSTAQALSGASQSFLMLLLIRLAVGAGTAPAGPTLTSLVGDYFPARDRARVWGLLLTGELLGAGFGFVIAGEFASLGSWRWAFFALAAPGIAVAYAVWRWLPEPLRGGASRLEPGADEIITTNGAQPAQEADEFDPSAAQRKVADQHVPPLQELVLHADPSRMRLRDAVRYVLRVRTNVVLIIASALGYFYFGGVETFGIVFIQGRYRLSHSTAVLVIAGIGVAAIVGVIVGGWLADWLMGRGNVNGRIWVGGVGFIAAALLFLPGLELHSIGYAIGFYVLAGMAFGARNPSLDAARLDVMHHRLWGRAEGVRTVLRRLMTATAPVVFGVIADALAGGPAIKGATGFGANASAHGLHLTFLLLLVMLAGGGVLTLVALKTYRRDVSTALASEQATVRSRP